MSGQDRIQHINELLEVIYRVDLPQLDWQRSVAEHVFERQRMGTGVLGYEFDASGGDGFVQVGTVVDIGAIDEFRRLAAPIHDRPVGADYAHAVARGTHAGTTRETLRRAGVRNINSSLILRSIETIGYHDIWAVCSVNPDASGMAFAIPCTEAESTLPRNVSGEWMRVGVHIAASLRLRRRLAEGPRVEPAGVFSPDGRPQDLRSDAVSDREALGRFVRTLDTTRAATLRGRDTDLLSLWRGLVAGRWSVFDHVDTDGKHYIVVYENDPDAAGPRKLSRRETQVATYAAQGHTNKAIAYELGIAVTTVATHLRAALAKLGVKRRTDLVWLYGELSPEWRTLGADQSRQNDHGASTEGTLG